MKKQLRLNRIVDTTHWSFLHLLCTITSSVLQVYVLSPLNGNSTIYCNHSNSATRLNEGKFSNLFYSNITNIIELGITLQYHLSKILFRDLMVYLKKKDCNDTDKRCSNGLISIFHRTQTVKKLSNKFIVYHIKSMTAFEAVCGYIACIIYICLSVFSQSDIITLCQTL